jgi:hypothetical protein
LHDWVDDAPRQLDFVRSCEEAGVARQRVEQEPFIGVGHLARESAFKSKIEIGQPQIHRRVRHFGL